jgi:hypothetical protein
LPEPYAWDLRGSGALARLDEVALNGADKM